MTKLIVAMAGLATLFVMAPARAADNPMQVCGAKYQAAKKANQLPAGQTWPRFLSACRGGLAKPAGALAPVRSAATAPKAPSAGQLAARDREKKCGAMWKADKAAGKTAGQTWPKYWSACNARLKS